MSEAELILANARVHTGVPGRPPAETMAVAGGRLLAVGRWGEVNALRGPNTVVRDLDGAFVMPGLVDVHNHHAVAGFTELYELSVPASASLDELLAAVRRHAATLPTDAWVSGGSWGSTLLDELNTDAARERLDEAAGGRPVLLSDDSHHNRWASSRALELAGIAVEATATGPATDTGVLRDPASGRPSGVLIESAGIPVTRARDRTGAPSAAQHREASRRGVEILNSHGVTAFQDAATSLETLRALGSLDQRGELSAWVVSSLPVNDPIFGSEPVGRPLLDRAEEFRSEHHRPDFVKIFLDGVPPARTAAFLEPYLPDDTHGADYRGSTTLDAEELFDWLRHTAERGLSAKVHCTGDASARLLLDTVERLRAAGFTGTRYHIAHGQFLAEEDLGRLGGLGVACDISPFLWFPGVIPSAIATVLPAERAARMQPNRSLLDLGTLVAAGSDWPVSASPNPWEGIQGLVTRADPHGAFPGALWPEQAITLDEAIAVFTANAATAMGLGEVTGSLEAGKSADFVVLDRDPFRVDPSSLVDVRVVETWFTGRRVFAR